MIKFFRLFHTLRYLKTKQIAYRLYYRFRRLKPFCEPVPKLRNAIVRWSAPAYMKPSTSDGRVFSFLGTTAEIDGDWNSSLLPKLWLYNLHYHDDLNSIGAEDRLKLCRQLVDDWVDSNTPLQGNGWEPYCISLRVVNWVKWLSRLKPEQIKPEWLQSLALQVDALDQQIEHHILSNHLFANAKALVFAGTFFDGQHGQQWLHKGLKLLDQEVAEQFLADGAHYELSPMYHSILLWDLADLICLQQNTALPVLTERVAEWKQRFTHGVLWLKSMVHSDMELSFFNDSTLGIAPTMNDIVGYGKYLGLDVSDSKSISQLQGDFLASSGYCAIDWPENHRLIVDVAKVGPNYQPGHAHADTLSCELSLFSQRVMVNSGISQYGADAERHRQRSTAAHNTLVVDNENSSEVWAGFRVARRAKPFDVEMEQSDKCVILRASHDGYYRLAGKVIHKRQWIAEPSALNIVDELSGSFKSATAYWHLHPDINLRRLGDTSFELALPQGQTAKLHIKGAIVDVCDSTWHPGFGKAISNNKLVLKLSGSTLETHIEWCTP